MFYVHGLSLKDVPKRVPVKDNNIPPNQTMAVNITSDIASTKTLPHSPKAY